jgi:hypothetical protein
MWIRLENKSEEQLLKESVDRLESKVQFMEAVNELQNSIYESGMYDEDTGKAMAWLKEKLQKVCPSPDKLKEFFSGLGKKMDAKVQACKYDSIKNAWNSLKGMMAATDAPDDQGGEEEAEVENPEGGEEVSDEEIPTDGEEDEGEEELAAESLYEEGLWDSIKSGWNKLTGKGEEPASAKGRGKKRGAKKPVGKKGAVKKGAAPKKGVAKKGTIKKGAAKKGAAKKGTSKKGKKGAKNQGDWKSKIWEFVKGHWKQITIVLIACLALYFLGAWVAAMFLKSPVAKSAATEVSKFRLPIGMKKLPPGAKLVGNGAVKFANGGWCAAPVGDIDVDF